MDSSEEREPKKRISILELLGLKKLIIIVVIVLVLIGILFLGFKYSENFTHQEKTTKLGLENVGILVTQTCYTTVVEDSKVNRDFFKLFEIPFTESRQIFSYDIEVDAAMDFEKIKYNVNSGDKIINVKVPHIMIYKTNLKQDSLKVYLDSESLFSRINLDKHNEAIAKMKETAINDCKANNLLEAALDNAERIIEGFFKTNETYQDYNVVFEFIDGR